LIKLHQAFANKSDGAFLRRGFDKRFNSLSGGGRQKFSSSLANLKKRKISNLSGAYSEDEDDDSKFATNMDSDTYKEAARTFFASTLDGKYLLGSFNWFQLFLRAVRQRHDYFSPFFGYSLRRRRFIRWILLTYFVFIAIFIDTLFYQIFYPDDGFCSSHNSHDDCVASMNKATSQRTCQWTVDSSYATGGYCDLRSPPQTVQFIVVLALVVIVIGLPLRIFAEIIVEEFCIRRPDLEIFGLDTNSWLGSSTAVTKKKYLHEEHDIYTYTEASAVDYNTAASLEKRRSSRATSFANKYEGMGLQATASTKNRQLRNQTKKIYADYLAPEEEALILLDAVKEFLSSAYPHGYLPWRDPRRSSAASNYHTMRAIREKLGINPDGSASLLNLRKYVLYGSPFKHLVAKITYAREKMEQLYMGLKVFNEKEDNLMNEYIIQCFALGKIFRTLNCMI
jgi:hypothetical protein